MAVSRFSKPFTQVENPGCENPGHENTKPFFLAHLLASAGRVCANLYQPTNDIQAVHIGASTPLLIAAFAEQPPKESAAGGR